MLSLVFFLCLVGLAASSDADALVTCKPSIPLPGVTDSADLKKVDHSVLVGTYLFISVKQNNTVAVIDTSTSAFITSLGPIGFPQGIAATKSGLVIAASSSTGNVTAYSASPPFAQAWSTLVGLDADNVRVDDASGLVWVANGGGESGDGLLTPLKADTGVIIQDLIIHLGPNHPEEFNLSPITRWLTVSVPSASGSGTVQVFDRSNAFHIAQFPGSDTTWAQPFAQRLDATGQRLYVATAGDLVLPAQLVVLNALDGTLLWAMPTGTPCDDIIVDSTGGLVLVAGGGKSSADYVIQVTSAPSAGVATAWKSLGAITLTPPANTTNARGLAWSPQTRTLYGPIPLVTSSGQTPQVVVMTIATPKGGGEDDDDEDDDDDDDKKLGWGAVAGIAAVATFLGAGLYYGLSKTSLCKKKDSQFASSSAEDAAYSSIN